MKKVITYGTYDLLHRGHIRLLERARDLGDYLIVGVTADAFDRDRGKINVVQSLAERIEAVRATGLADEIIVEEYEGQKIDDIQRLGIDVFAIGSDWSGKFDYLSDYCEVVYLERTEGISSSTIRSERAPLKLGIIGEGSISDKYARECAFINGLTSARCYFDEAAPSDAACSVDAVFIASSPNNHARHVRRALELGKHVLCESPIALTGRECAELFALADSKGLVLREAIKTAYSTAYHRLLLLLKGGRIGRVISVQATCTSLFDLCRCPEGSEVMWPSSSDWGPTALLPILQILGVEYKNAAMSRCDLVDTEGFDVFGKIDLIYADAIGTAIFGKAVKSEGSLVVSGTEGYVYVPAPWWKTDYFEIRREDTSRNERFFYQLDGEGIRYELMTFARAIRSGCDSHPYINRDTSIAIANLLERFLDTDPFTCIDQSLYRS